MIDYDDLKSIQQRIADLQQEQRDRLPAYIKAKHIRALYRDRKKRLLARFEREAPAGLESMAARTSWALSNLHYIEAVEQLESEYGDAGQEMESYETIQPQLDMLRSQLSLVKEQMRL